MQETMPDAHRMDNINTWTGLPVEESIRMTEDRDKWTKYVHGVANSRIENGSITDRTAKSSTVNYRHNFAQVLPPDELDET